jgi:hypothetical protein
LPGLYTRNDWFEFLFTGQGYELPQWDESLFVGYGRIGDSEERRTGCLDVEPHLISFRSLSPTVRVPPWPPTRLLFEHKTERGDPLLPINDPEPFRTVAVAPLSHSRKNPIG